MKKIQKLCLIVVALFIFSGTASAKIVNFGLKAGLNVNHLSFNKEFGKLLTDKSNSVGWEIGGMAEFNVPIIGLCFDASLMYARMNNATEASYKTADPMGDININGESVGKNFLMIPINIKYKFQLPIVSNWLAPYIFTGPEFAFKLDKNTYKEIKSRTCQVAWNIGLGLQFINHVQIGASYGFGINKIAESVVGTQAPDFSIKNNYWTVTAAYIF